MVVSEFKGKLMVNIREYYEKDGKSLPGKKVSLPCAIDHSAVAISHPSRLGSSLIGLDVGNWSTPGSIHGFP